MNKKILQSKGKQIGLDRLTRPFFHAQHSAIRLRWFDYAHHKSGQAMIILVMFLGATMLGITTIAGFITLQKIRTVTDIVDSTKAIYAADAGIEWWLYNTYSSGGGTPQPTFSNESSVTITDISENEVRSVGNTHRAYRAFGLFQN